MSSNNHYIRPAARHMFTIGRDLIQDPTAALIELIKNSYDADSPDVVITFSANDSEDAYEISIEDHGHGMSRETVLGTWMVPSTENKLHQEKSKSRKRHLQGHKGIGRYAASILGDTLELETIDETGERTVAFIDWSQFEKIEFLDQVPISIKTDQTEKASGTKLTIKGGKNGLEYWTISKPEKRQKSGIFRPTEKNNFIDLQYQLQKLISPLEGYRFNKESPELDSFQIKIKTINFVSPIDKTITIEPLPLLELYDYKIYGHIKSDGTASLKFHTQKIKNLEEEDVSKRFIGKKTKCGDIYFDIRVYDRDNESLDEVIKRGKEKNKNDLSQRKDIRDLLDNSNGIGVFRNGFRIRPLGDANFDWLELSAKRVQDTSKIDFTQAIGLISIESESKSNLIEKSARDGLKENLAFSNLKEISLEVINILEIKRIMLRKQLGKMPLNKKTFQQIDDLFELENLKKSVEMTLAKNNVPSDVNTKVMHLIMQQEEVKQKIAKELRKTIALYQGQATLGSIVNVLLHEGRKPIQGINEYSEELIHQFNLLNKKTKSFDFENETLNNPIQEIRSNAADISALFKRIDPLSSKRSEHKKIIRLKDEVQKIADLFNKELKREKIKLEITDHDQTYFLCWANDIRAIFTNLIDNSIYWISTKSASDGADHSIKISIHGDGNGSLLEIVYSDTGPGIDNVITDPDIIFEPHFTTKPNGQGLGLAIAGECAHRNSLKLELLDATEGIEFSLRPLQPTEEQ